MIKVEKTKQGKFIVYQKFYGEKRKDLFTTDNIFSANKFIKEHDRQSRRKYWRNVRKWKELKDVAPFD